MVDNQLMAKKLEGIIANLKKNTWGWWIFIVDVDKDIDDEECGGQWVDLELLYIFNQDWIYFLLGSDYSSWSQTS